MDAPPQPPPPVAVVPNAMDHLVPLGHMINDIANMAAAGGGGGNANVQATLAAIQLQLNQMQHQIQLQLDQITAELRRISLNETRARNHQVANVSEARVVYPPGTNHAALEVLAETIGEVTDISGDHAAEALGHLGIQDPVDNLQRRLVFWRHIGILPL